MQKSIRRHWWLFLLPTAAAFAIVFLLPFLMGLALSFTEFTTVTNAKWVGLANYVKAFTKNGEFIDALWFTAKFTAVAVLTVNLLAFAMAMLLTKSIPGTNLYRTVFFMPNLIGGIVLGWIWQMIFNGVLMRYGMTLTTNPDFGFWGLVILMNWQMIGYMMIIYIAGIQNIPGDLY
ncbi:MAG: sugar ABC transporter permease, partial [Clostridia bacterium]